MKDLILKLLRNVESDLIQDQTAKGITASGASAASIDPANVSDKGGQLVGNDYIYFQINGRKPGKRPPIQSMIEWIESKGIVPDGISVKSLAFLIARKIGAKGSDIYQGKRSPLAYNTIIEDNMQQFTREFTEEYGKQLMARLFKAFSIALLVLCTSCGTLSRVNAPTADQLKAAKSMKPKTEKEVKTGRRALLISLGVGALWLYGFQTYGE